MLDPNLKEVYLQHLTNYINYVVSKRSSIESFARDHRLTEQETNELLNMELIVREKGDYDWGEE